MITLKTSTLHEVGQGLLAAALDKKISEVIHDISERPGVKAPRKVILELIIKKSDSGEDTVDAMDVQFSVDAKIPKTTMKRTMASFPRQNSLGFETDTNKHTHARNQKAFDHSDDDGSTAEE